MMDAETRRMIREEIKQQLNIILNAAAGSQNDQQSETISTLFPGSPDIPGRPVMHPFGFVSRAVPGTISVVAKVGADMQNRMTLGHRDFHRPSDLNSGESIVYSIGDYRVKVTNTSILVGKGGVYEPVLVGETTRQFLISLVQLIIVHTHLGNLGIETGPPLNSTDFNQLQSQNLDNSKVLAEDGGRF